MKTEVYCPIYQIYNVAKNRWLEFFSLLTTAKKTAPIPCSCLWYKRISDESCRLSLRLPWKCLLTSHYVCSPCRALSSLLQRFLSIEEMTISLPVFPTSFPHQGQMRLVTPLCRIAYMFDNMFLLVDRGWDSQTPGQWDFTGPWRCPVSWFFGGESFWLELRPLSLPSVWMHLCSLRIGMTLRESFVIKTQSLEICASYLWERSWTLWIQMLRIWPGLYIDFACWCFEQRSVWMVGTYVFWYYDHPSKLL